MHWTQTTFRYTIPLFHPKKREMYIRRGPSTKNTSVRQAIDLMTRRLIVSGRSSAAVGTYFSLGHSTYVISSPSQCGKKKFSAVRFSLLFCIYFLAANITFPQLQCLLTHPFCSPMSLAHPLNHSLTHTTNWLSNPL